MRSMKTWFFNLWRSCSSFISLSGIFITCVIIVAFYLSGDFSHIVVKEHIISRENHFSRSKVSNVKCNLFSGKWIYNNVSYPLYKEEKCSFMEDEFACQKFGRKDLNYTHWRWQPNDCDLPRFNGTALLEKIRGKKVVYVGDSLNRNQWRSMLCLIESSLPPNSNKSLVMTGNWHLFQSIEYNATIGFYWSPLLVESNCDDPVKHPQIGRIVRIDSIEKHAQHWTDADILIFDSYVWWTNPTITILWGSFGSQDATYKKIPMKMRQYEMALDTLSDWLEFNVNRTRTRLFFMSRSPTHYKEIISGATTNCYVEKDPIPNEKYIGSVSRWEQTAKSIIRKLKGRGLKIEYIDITKLSLYRKDAHPSVYRIITYSDCIHWCLPGVADVWNEILFEYIMDM